jgi:hypothetical protein
MKYARRCTRAESSSRSSKASISKRVIRLRPFPTVGGGRNDRLSSIEPHHSCRSRRPPSLDRGFRLGRA